VHLLNFVLQGNQLDFLLSKASEYSNFIAKDLDELQASMTEAAKKALAKAEKKRRKGENGGGGKKQKTSKGAQKLESVQAKDAVVRNAGTKPIFIQPPNLAADCFLKDYQLEGVRWLASLFENGVSGILADGTWIDSLYGFLL
jgi:ATP-dependent DNA helicase